MKLSEKAKHLRVIIAELGQVPENLDFVVAQTRTLPPVISADLFGTSVPQMASGIVVELNPHSLTLGDNGSVIGEAKVDVPADAGFALVPILSNVNPDGTIRNDLVDNLLVDPALQQTHIDNIARTVTENAYHGIEIDYRAINPGLRDAFSSFVAQLAKVLDQQGKVVSVRVEFRRQVHYDS